MLGLDPEGPVPLEMIGQMPVSLAVRHWEMYEMPTPVSGDPYFRRKP